MKILTYPNPNLTIPTKPWDFAQEDSKVKLLFMSIDLANVLATAPNGLALAANQVGLGHRLFVVEQKFAEREALHPLVINPQWHRREGSNWVEENEGCLSFPDLRLDIKRQDVIFAEYYDIEGVRHERTLDGLGSRMFQHECEHLDGETFLEYIPRIKRFQIMAELRKAKGA